MLRAQPPACTSAANELEEAGGGFRNFDTHRLRLLLTVGLANRALAGFACDPDQRPLHHALVAA